MYVEDRADISFFSTFGDLWNLDRQYLRADNMRFGYLPEPFAWSVLEGLLKTCLVMQYGDTTSPIPGWTPIVHRDLKTANGKLAQSISRGCKDADDG